MNAEEEIFEAAAALPEAERPGYLDNACAGQPELRGRIEALIRSHDATGFMEGGTAVSQGGDERLSTHVPVEQSGERIGRYRLLQQIGEGGFGTVWMAEQMEPVTRRVALKIIKAGMDTKEVIARFEAERQALAMMDHANIAKVLDAGATDSGRPFFVMELVKGIPITRFCDEQQFTTRQRLELFGDVCSAINHAHQKGIIHRDIKPSNVMVTLNADRPVVKVIDFGIAKATQGRLTDKTLFTRFEQFIGTPAYMSPEQAVLSELDLDTRSDIYALGILLYELLTGKPPFDTRTLVSAGYDEMRRIIREVEPARPSVRLNTIAGAERTELAKARRIEPEKLGRLVQPDLDWIVMKAIEKDRTRRYETAHSLALDIGRFLSDEPVSAGPPGTGYRLRKFARRHKTALRVAAGIAALLVAATVVSTWQAIRATQAEHLAFSRLEEKKQALRDAEDTINFLGDVFQRPDPWLDGRSITVAKTLDRAAEKLKTELASQPGHRARLQADLGRSYFALGLYPEAILHQEQVLAYCQDTYGLEHSATIKAMNNLAISLHDSGQPVPRGRALNMREQLLPLSRRVNGPTDTATLSAMTNLASSLEDAGQQVEALKLEKEVLPLRRMVSGPDDPETLRAMSNLANTLFNAGNLEDALKLRQEVLPISKTRLGPKHPETLRAMQSLAISLAGAGREEEALAMRWEVLDLRKDVLGEDHPETIGAMHYLASSLYDANQLDAALQRREEVKRLYEKRLKWEHPETLGAMHNLAISLDAAGRLDEAIDLQKRVLRLREQVESPDHPDTLAAKHSLANFYSKKKDQREEALKLRQEVVDACLNSEALGPMHPDTFAAMSSLIVSYKDARMEVEAAELRGQLESLRVATFPAVRTVLVPPTLEWRWFHPTSGKDPEETAPGFHTSFFLPDFNDSAWNTGTDSAAPAGGFGYGRTFDAAKGVGIGTPEEGQRHTAYFRLQFHTQQRQENLELRCQRDDGIIIYLDGKEVARDNMPGGADSWSLPAKSPMQPDNDGTVHRVVIPRTLDPGLHTLAISLHNIDPRSSDLRLGGVTLVEVELPKM